MSTVISKVKQKLKQVKFRHLKKYLSANLKEDPRNCTHNEIQTSEKGEVGVCGYEGAKTQGMICDINYDSDRAKTCGLFCPKKDKSSLKKEFFEFVDQSPRAILAQEFSDITALMWVLETIGDDLKDTDLKDHYEHIEDILEENKELTGRVEYLQSKLKTERDFKVDLQSQIFQLSKQLSEENKPATLSPPKKGLWGRLIGWWKNG